jgi:NADPH:quinone reductase-like Zn-dependent oxidoreductase
MGPQQQKEHAMMSSAAADGTMQAVVQEAYGSAEVLRPARVAPPAVAGDEILVRVRAAGLGRDTWHLMTGRPYLLRLVFGIRRPRSRVPGRELAGTVAAVGPAVTRFAVGDEVFGIGKGTYAEYAVAREGKLARKPAAASFAQAAAVPISALTALQALRDAGRIQSGQSVLILGASGGVGSYAVQLAKAVGADVTGVCSTSKLDLVRSLGADEVIDYTRGDFADGGKQYDLIVDLAGRPALSRLRRALRPQGTAVFAGGEGGGSWTGGVGRQLRGLALTPFVGQRLVNCICKENAGDLERLAGYIEAGQVTPAIDRAYPLDQLPEAMRYFASGQARGKVAITI